MLKSAWAVTALLCKETSFINLFLVLYRPSWVAACSPVKFFCSTPDTLLICSSGISSCDCKWLRTMLDTELYNSAPQRPLETPVFRKIQAGLCRSIALLVASFKHSSSSSRKNKSKSTSFLTADISFYFLSLVSHAMSSSLHESYRSVSFFPLFALLLLE